MIDIQAKLKEIAASEVTAKLELTLVLEEYKVVCMKNPTDPALEGLRERFLSICDQILASHHANCVFLQSIREKGFK